MCRHYNNAVCRIVGSIPTAGLLFYDIMEIIKIQVEGYKCEGCGNESLNKSSIRFCENRHQCEMSGHKGHVLEVETNPFDDDSRYSTIFKIEKRCVKCSSIVERKVFDFSEMSQEVLEKLYEELPEKKL